MASVALEKKFNGSQLKAEVSAEFLVFACTCFFVIVIRHIVISY